MRAEIVYLEEIKEKLLRKSDEENKHMKKGR